MGSRRATRSSTRTDWRLRRVAEDFDAGWRGRRLWNGSWRRRTRRRSRRSTLPFDLSGLDMAGSCLFAESLVCLRGTPSSSAKVQVEVDCRTRPSASSPRRLLFLPPTTTPNGRRAHCPGAEGPKNRPPPAHRTRKLNRSPPSLHSSRRLRDRLLLPLARQGSPLLRLPP